MEDSVRNMLVNYIRLLFLCLSFASAIGCASKSIKNQDALTRIRSAALIELAANDTHSLFVTDAERAYQEIIETIQRKTKIKFISHEEFEKNESYQKPNYWLGNLFPDKMRSIVKYNYKDHTLKTFELEKPRQQLFEALKVDALFFISTNVSSSFGFSERKDYTGTANLVIYDNISTGPIL